MRKKSNRANYLALALSALSIGVAFGSYYAIEEAQANISVQSVMSGVSGDGYTGDGYTGSHQLTTCYTASEFDEFVKTHGIKPVGIGITDDEQTLIGIMYVEDYFYITETRRDRTDSMICMLRYGFAWQVDPSLRGLPL